MKENVIMRSKVDGITLKAAKKPRKPYNYEEDQDSYNFAIFLNAYSIKFAHIGNESGQKPTPNILAMMKKKKKKGVSPGVPDYMIILPKRLTKLTYDKLIFIELKKQKGGTVSIEQKQRLNSLSECEGIETFVARGFLEAKAIIDGFIN